MTSAACVYVGVLLLVCLPSSLGWGLVSHRISGHVASHYLDERATKNIQALLGGNGTNLWHKTATFPQGPIAYPDAYARTPAGKWSYDNHFVEALGTPYYLAKDCDRRCCVVGAIDKFAQELWLQFKAGVEPPASSDAGNTGDDPLLKTLLVAHLIGDIHQPLHVSIRDDYGGNTWKVTYLGNTTCFNTPCNLHKVVDTMLTSTMLEPYGPNPPFFSKQDDPREPLFAQQLIKDMGPLVAPQGDSPAALPAPAIWASRSAELSSTFYSTHTIDELWVEAMIPPIRLQIFMAGFRIAEFINAVFGMADLSCPDCQYTPPICIKND